MVMRNEAAAVRHCRKAALEALPGLLQARGPAFYAQGTFATKADASAWLANTETDLGRGTWVDPQRGQETFQQYAGTWMNRTDLADSTRGKYEGLLRLHILPTFGKVELRRLAGAATWSAVILRARQAVPGRPTAKRLSLPPRHREHGRSGQPNV